MGGKKNLLYCFFLSGSKTQQPTSHHHSSKEIKKEEKTNPLLSETNKKANSQFPLLEMFSITVARENVTLAGCCSICFVNIASKCWTNALWYHNDRSASHAVSSPQNCHAATSGWKFRFCFEERCNCQTQNITNNPQSFARSFLPYHNKSEDSGIETML